MYCSRNSLVVNDTWVVANYSMSNVIKINFHGHVCLKINDCSKIIVFCKKKQHIYPWRHVALKMHVRIPYVSWVSATQQRSCKRCCILRVRFKKILTLKMIPLYFAHANFVKKILIPFDSSVNFLFFSFLPWSFVFLSKYVYHVAFNKYPCLNCLMYRRYFQ